MPQSQPVKIQIDIEEQLEKLREATREANEAAQNLRQAKKDVQEIWKVVEQEVSVVIAQHTANGLKSYDTALQTAIKKAEAAIYKRFDDLADILLGEDARAKGLPLAEFAARIADMHRQRAMRLLGVDSLDTIPATDNSE